jgi:hypothetical protein
MLLLSVVASPEHFATWHLLESADCRSVTGGKFKCSWVAIVPQHTHRMPRHRSLRISPGSLSSRQAWNATQFNCLKSGPVSKGRSARSVDQDS